MVGPERSSFMGGLGHGDMKASLARYVHQVRPGWWFYYDKDTGNWERDETLTATCHQ